MAKLVLLGLVLPVVVCAAALIGAWRPWRPGAPIAGGLWAGAVALGAGFVPAFLAADPWPDLPPHVTWHWIAWLAVVAAAVGAADGLHRWPLRVRLSAGLALAAGCGWLLVGDWVTHAWAWRGATAVVIAVLLATLNASAGRHQGASVPLSMCLAALGASIVLVLSGNAKLAQLVGALAACLGAAVVLAWWRPEVSLARGGVQVVAVLLPGLVLSGYFLSWSEIAPWVFVLAAIAPALLWVSGSIPLDRLPPWQATAVRVAVTALPVAVAMTAAMATRLHEAPSSPS